jgi:hypothetical protein
MEEQMLAASLTTFGLVLDRLIQLVDRREKVNRNVFADYVAPVMADFEAVHKDYMESLKRYGDRLQDKTVEFSLEHPIFEEIRRDRISAKHLQTRARVLSASDGFDRRLSWFAWQISCYFWLSAEPHLPDATDYGAGSARAVLGDTLSEICERNDEDRYELAQKAVWHTAEKLQSGHAEVFAAFTRLKADLLDPI